MVIDQREHEAWNEEMSRRYDPDAFITRSGWPIRLVESLRLRRTRQALGSGPSACTLDLGCGPGNLLELLEGRRLVGVDLSEGMLAQARRRLAGRPGVELLKADAESLPFPAGTFDRVVCSEVLEHVRDPQRVVAEVHRVCRAGARVVFTVPNEELIARTKSLVLGLGLRRAVAGAYAMSEDMLDGWHLRQLAPSWICAAGGGRFVPAGRWDVPSALLPYHHVLAFDAEKP